MEPDVFGTEQVTEADRAYKGSHFSEVRDALFANSYQKVWGRAGEPPLPIYDVTLLSVLRGITPFGQPYLFRQATERAVDSHADFALGPRRQRVPPHSSSERGVSHGRLGDHRADQLFRLFCQRKPGFVGGTLLYLLHRDPARSHAFVGAGGQAMSYHGPEPLRAATYRQLYHPTGLGRRLYRLHK